MKEIVFPARAADALRATLLSHIESSAVLLAGLASSADGARLLVRDMIVPADDDYTSRSAIDAELSPAFVARVTKQAKLANLALIFAHSHPGTDPPHFSSTDDVGEQRLNEFLGRRHSSVPHATLVVSEGGMRARELGGGRAVRVLALGAERRTILFDESCVAIPSPSSVFDRQVRVLGQTGQERIAALRVAVVGLGGTGSLIVQQLVHLGVRDFILIDPDTLEDTNLNRVAGAVFGDIGAPKVSIAERYITAFAPTSNLRPIKGDITRARSAAPLRDADFIFGCTDSHGSRAVLQQIAYQYLIPCIDLGSTITARQGMITGIFGRVQALAPGLACFACGNLLDADEIRRDMMNDFERKMDPYIVGERTPAPAVISLNGTVVSFAVTMFMSMVAGLPSPARHLVYNAMSSSLRSVEVEQKSNCYICSHKGSFARGDDQPLFARTD